MPELTPEQKLSITRHLAEKVMGWELLPGNHIVPNAIFYRTAKRIVSIGDRGCANDWDPFTDANATLEVLSVFHDFEIEADGPPSGNTDTYPLVVVRVAKDRFIDESPEGTAMMPREDFSHAVCLACANATGWEG